MKKSTKICLSVLALALVFGVVATGIKPIDPPFGLIHMLGL